FHRLVSGRCWQSQMTLLCIVSSPTAQYVWYKLPPKLAQCADRNSIYPITSASAEQSFTAVKYLKSYFRSTMIEERLNGLAVMCTFILTFLLILTW
ncbi:conserved hypothetical protein, partial [Trichinella spiralis]|uniref:hypothetical protein n=1 Tax=Trichinella spiralis TaxID=6334 RepID=UPI0001EFD6BE